MGSAREAREARDRAAATAREEEVQAERRRLSRRRSSLDAQIAALQAQREAESLELSGEIGFGGSGVSGGGRKEVR